MKTSTKYSPNSTSGSCNGYKSFHGNPFKELFEYTITKTGSIPDNEEPEQTSRVADDVPNEIRQVYSTQSMRHDASRGRPSSNHRSGGRAHTNPSADKTHSRTNKENDAPSNIRSSVETSSKTPKKMTGSDANGDRRNVLSPKTMSRKKSFTKCTEQYLMRQITMKDASTQTYLENDWVKTKVFGVRLNNVTRALQNRSRGDPNRGDLGPGNLMIMKCVQHNVIHHMCIFRGDNGSKFLAELPKSSDAHNHMRLGTGENTIVWDAYDSSRFVWGGAHEETMLRRFFFSFNCKNDMIFFLLRGFDGQIVNEFRKGENGLFKPSSDLPPHSIVKNENDMEVNSDDEEHCSPPLTEEEEKVKFPTKVNRESLV